MSHHDLKIYSRILIICIISEYFAYVSISHRTVIGIFIEMIHIADLFINSHVLTLLINHNIIRSLVNFLFQKDSQIHLIEKSLVFFPNKSNLRLYLIKISPIKQGNRLYSRNSGILSRRALTIESIDG